MSQTLFTDIATSNEWYLLRGEEKFGPYTYADLVSFLQKNKVFLHDYVWTQHLEAWSPIGELPEFSFERTARLREKNEQTPVFEKRKHHRVYCDLGVYVNNQQNIYHAVIKTLSVGGALILIQNPLLYASDQLVISFRETVFSKNLNLKSEIIQKRYTKERIQHDSWIFYTVKFLDTTKEAQDLIQDTINLLSEKKGEKL